MSFSFYTKKSQYALISCVLVLLCVYLSYLFCPKPDLHTYTTYSKALFDDSQKLIRMSLAADDRYRLHQDIKGISESHIKATLLYEDNNFYQHKGVDLFALIRAFWTTYVQDSRRVGASTITMQLARLRWNIPSSTVIGKLQQIARAIQLNRHFSKDEILQAYFNHAPYGRNIEGIAAASLIYFDKTPDRLTWAEAMTLSVIPQNPNSRDPSTESGYANIVSARNRLLSLWQQAYPNEQLNPEFLDIPLKVRGLAELPFEAPHFSQYLIAKLPRWHNGFVQTTLNLDLQHQMEKGVHKYIQENSLKGIHNAAALLVNYESNEIKAMVGSADFYNKDIQGQVNGTLAKRSPGSALKPFVYALAMDEGIIHPMTMLRDAQKRFGGFTPENYDRKFLGPVFARTALIESRNVPAVDLQARLQSRSFHHFLTDAGVEGLQDEGHYGLALALGGGEVSMLEMARLYALFANGGVLNKIDSYTGGTEKSNTLHKQLISPESSYLILDILRDNPPPGDQAAFYDKSYKNDIAWKTGTSWAFRDAWSVGISGPYVLVVWVGNFDGSGNAAFVGRTAAGPLLFSLFNALNQSRGWRLEDAFKVSSLNIKKIDVCASSGDLPNKHCPRTKKSWFIPGVSPIKISSVHREVIIDKRTGLRACQNVLNQTGVGHDKNPKYEATSKTEIFEFWPSDFLQLFQQAGISLKTPPKYHPDCDLNSKSNSGQLPRITSPMSTLEYTLQSTKVGSNTIQFSATVDSDVEQLYWFVDGQYVGKAKQGELFSWMAVAGRYNVSVVDDSGRAASVKISVGRVN